MYALFALVIFLLTRCDITDAAQYHRDHFDDSYKAIQPPTVDLGYSMNRANLIQV